MTRDEFLILYDRMIEAGWTMKSIVASGRHAAGEERWTIEWRRPAELKVWG